MKRFSALLIICILLSACMTEGSNFFDSNIRQTELINALSSSPYSSVDKDPVQESFAMAEPQTWSGVSADNPPESTEMVQAASDSEEMISENEVLAEDAANAESQDDILPEPAEETDNSKLMDIPEEDAETAIPAEDYQVIANPVPAAIYPPMNRGFMNAEMSDWMIRLMMASFAIIILFSFAVAIRGTSRKPLPRWLSFLMASVIAAIPFVVSIIVGGYSPIWLVYITLLFSFLIFRSDSRRHFR